MERGADFSPCRTYRYLLWRVWDTDGSPLNVIGLNPSTADEAIDDPTIRRCVDFAQQWGYGSLVMTNLYGYRSTDPQGLLLVGDPVGPGNDAALRLAAWRAGRTIAAWGAHTLATRRVAAVSTLLDWIPVDCLGLTKSGAPRHPLYMPKTTRPVPFWSGIEEVRP